MQLKKLFLGGIVFWYWIVSFLVLNILGIVNKNNLIMLRSLVRTVFYILGNVRTVFKGVFAALFLKYREIGLLVLPRISIFRVFLPKWSSRLKYSVDH